MRLPLLWTLNGLPNKCSRSGESPWRYHLDVKPPVDLFRTGSLIRIGRHRRLVRDTCLPAG
jgi:hypothetical protein